MCILCDLVKEGNNLVYSDDYLGAVVLSDGYSLGDVKLFPKKHYQKLLEIDDESLKAMGKAILKISDELLRITGCEGYNILSDDAFGLEHFSVDIVPRFSDDDLDFSWPIDKNLVQQLADTQARLKASINVIDVSNKTIVLDATTKANDNESIIDDAHDNTLETVKEKSRTDESGSKSDAKDNLNNVNGNKNKVSEFYERIP